MSNLQHLTEKESSCFVLLWPVTLSNNDVRMCWDKPDEVLSAARCLLGCLFFPYLKVSFALRWILKIPRVTTCPALAENPE